MYTLEVYTFKAMVASILTPSLGSDFTNKRKSGVKLEKNMNLGHQAIEDFECDKTNYVGGAQDVRAITRKSSSPKPDVLPNTALQRKSVKFSENP